MSIRSLFIASACGALLTACGGGGGGGPAPAPGPAPLPIPPSIDATRMTLAERQAPCSSNARCIFAEQTAISANGEITAYWQERVPGDVAELKAANVAPGGMAPLSVGVVERDFSELQLRIRSVSDRRFAAVYQMRAAAGAPLLQRARIVDMAASGAPTVLPAVDIGNLMGAQTPMVRDFDGNLFAVHLLPSINNTLPFPALNFGAGVNVTVVSIVQSPFNVTSGSVLADYQSIAPRALWAFVAPDSAGGPEHIYAADVSLTSGQVLPPIKNTTARPYVWVRGNLTCFRPLQVQSTGVGKYFVAWIQVNAPETGCDLMVSGQRIPASATDVIGEFGVSGRGDEAVAAWFTPRFSPTAPEKSRLLFSRRDAATQQWSLPAPVAPALSEPSDEHTVHRVVAGPNGTLVVSWQASRQGTVGSSPLVSLISKYVDGRWTTVSVGSEVLGMSINGQGQGAATVRDFGSDRLSLVRF